MNERVDVIEYDERVPVSDDSGLEQRQAVSLAMWLAIAVIVGYGLVESLLLASVVAASVILLVRVVVFRDEYAERTRYRAVETGRGAEVVRAHEHEARKRGQMRTALLALVVAVVFGYALLQGSLLLGVLAASLVGGVGYVVGRPGDDSRVPRLVEEDIDHERAREQFELGDEGP